MLLLYRAQISIEPIQSFLLLCLRPLQNYLHSLVVVSLDLEVRYPAVALGCRNLAMPQEILDGRKVRIGIEKLRGHGVAKPMTRDVQLALSRIVFDPFSDGASLRGALPKGRGEVMVP